MDFWRKKDSNINFDFNDENKNESDNWKEEAVLIVLGFGKGRLFIWKGVNFKKAKSCHHNTNCIRIDRFGFEAIEMAKKKKSDGLRELTEFHEKV